MLTLGEELIRYQKQGFLSFHTPGHKGNPDFFAGMSFPEHDLTELPGLDMLHASEGVIREAQQRASEIFGADESFFLVNGATVGNQAMLLSLAVALESTKYAAASSSILIQRQSHRSVYAALILSGLKPEYIPSIVHPEFNLPLGLDLSSLESVGDSLCALHLTYPGYYGSLPDLHALMQHRDARCPDVPILVDQAHGSHYLNGIFPASALELGADCVLHSSHKTLSALTQSAMLHVRGTRMERSALRQALELLQSSSPNYLLLASLERAAEQALQTWRWELLHEAVQELHWDTRNILRLLNPADQGTYGICQIDWSKILVNTRSLGLPAPLCVEYLLREFRVEPELWDEENILFLLGIGNTSEEVSVLKQGLLGLQSLTKGKNRERGNPARDLALSTLSPVPAPPLKLSPREAFFARKRRIPLRESLGKVAGESISPYPPGVPLIMMGEEITPEVLARLSDPTVRRWQGWDDPGGTVLVVDN